MTRILSAVLLITASATALSAVAQTSNTRTVTVHTPEADTLRPVVRARYIKPGDVSPEEYQRLLDEADRIRAYQDQTQTGVSGIVYNNTNVATTVPTYSSVPTYSENVTYTTTTGSSYGTVAATTDTYSAADQTYTYQPLTTSSQTGTVTTYQAPTRYAQPVPVVGTATQTYTASSYTEPATTYAQPTYTQTYTAPTQTYSPQAVNYGGTHTVAKGDTLYNISKRYNVDLVNLKSANGLTSNTIRIGQTLTLPSASVNYAASTQQVVTMSPAYRSYPITAGTSTDRTYAVLPKDTLYSIARYACVNVDELARANGITNANVLAEGQQLRMPSGHCLR